MRFRSKERGTRIKDRAKNGVSERAERGREGNSVSFLPLPSSHFQCLALVSFLARPKPRIPFLGLSLLRNQTETLATKATQRPVFFVPAGSPYVDSSLNLSTTATTTKACPQLPKINLSTTASFSQQLIKSQEWS